MQSCIYEGTVAHRRHEPVTHHFQYRLFMVYLDLDELPALVVRGGLIGDDRFAGRSFLRRDHLFDSARPLDDEVRDVIRTRTGRSSRGPIRLLTQLRYFGYFMSPLNLFFVYDDSGQRVEFVVAEVNNTPWNERHCYVLWDGNRNGRDNSLRFTHEKSFHVSPFLDMDMQYRWRLTEPADELTVHLANARDSRRLFDASMTLRRRDLSRQQLRRMKFRYPWMTAQISAAIYLQALKLWWKQCPFYPHPNKQNDSLPPAPASSAWRETSKTATP